VVGAATGRVALLSIHPRYADAILAGMKQVEFRRQALPADVTHAVIYATSPTQRIVGMFEISDILKLDPAEAWDHYHRVGGIDRAAFDHYYAGAQTAYVIEVRNPERFTAPFPLRNIDDNLRPPQSYQYLLSRHLDRTRELAAGCNGTPVSGRRRTARQESVGQ